MQRCVGPQPDNERVVRAQLAVVLPSHDNTNVFEPHRHLQLALGIRAAHVVRAGTQGAADELQTLRRVWFTGTLYVMHAIQGRRVRARLSPLCHPMGVSHSIQYSVMFIRGNGVTLRTQKVIQGGDNDHVGRPCEVSLAPPCPELFCELRGLCSHSYFGPRTCGRSEKPKSSKWRGPNPGFQRNPSPP